jgi:hypothetical protein
MHQAVQFNSEALAGVVGRGLLVLVRSLQLNFG